MINSLEITELSKTYKGKRQVKALDKISLKLQAGDFVAVLGPSGCGKSTLMLTAGGLLAPDSGQVLINDQNIYQMSNSQRAEFRAKSLAYVYQEFHLIPYLNVLDNVRIADLAIDGGSESKARDLLQGFGLANRADHLPSELSVGEQQRVALCRAIYSGAKIIFADEPTGNLDSENAEAVLQALKAFAEEGGIVLMVTHDDRAVAYAEKKLTMAAGQWNC